MDSASGVEICGGLGVGQLRRDSPDRAAERAVFWFPAPGVPAGKCNGVVDGAGVLCRRAGGNGPGRGPARCRAAGGGTGEYGKICALDCRDAGKAAGSQRAFHRSGGDAVADIGVWDAAGVSLVEGAAAEIRSRGGCCGSVPDCGPEPAGACRREQRIDRRGGQRRPGRGYAAPRRGLYGFGRLRQSGTG